MTIRILLTAGIHLAALSCALANSVSTYIPLSMDPETERRIEQALILAQQPPIKRPVPLSALREALPKVCETDSSLCQLLRTVLSTAEDGGLVTMINAEIAGASGSEHVRRNAFGLDSRSHWSAHAAASWQPLKFFAVSAGVAVDDNRIDAAGTVLSMGFDLAQLDIGYRSHWLSPLTESSMLVSTDAPTMPAVTLSNTWPITPAGLRYELFVAEMSTSDNIAFANRLTKGRPRMAGAHLSVEPIIGWSLGINRLLQYGGGERGGDGFGDLVNAFFNPGRFDNVNTGDLDAQLGNQVASVTSTFVFPTSNPVAVFLEYAGEDTSRNRNFLLGNTALSVGVRLPRLLGKYDAALEVSEWQNDWYINDVYGDGLTNRGRVIGHWGGNRRKPGDAVGASSAVARVSWTTERGADLDLRYSTLRNRSYGVGSYKQAHELSARYSRRLGPDVSAGGSLELGQDIFGESYGRLAMFLRYANNLWPGAPFEIEQRSRPARPNGAEWFVETGLSATRLETDLDDSIPSVVASSLAPHVAVGLRRAASRRQDIGVRVEVSRVENRLLAAVRAIDYRLRWRDSFAVNAFLGAARYDLDTPAYGLWAGAGIEWRDIRPRWDVGLEIRFGIKIARDDLLPSDPIGGRPDSFYDLQSIGMSFKRKF